MCAFGSSDIGRKVEPIIAKASRETASEVIHGAGFEGRYEDFDGGYTVGFETFTADVDMTPHLKGLPQDSCPASHWGYVVNGKVTYKIGEDEKEIEAGEAFYVPAGHTLFADADSELVFFSPTREWRQTVDKIGKQREAVFA
jgi:quercetin dioxygenase-like cupin family protein